ncbi:MFS general substrate transporter [Trametes coccinea BRFM310]|uniref:MFS general substrate transporter n=1 Tax=Trametes coccinea (strain BRFM310) TaxID=1353009 RepID=A0A1Y2I9H5_TRAC3|nr:MFS general substrate transporter [Trametes coccinea BRFM310]
MEVELATIHPRSPHPPAEATAATESATFNNNKRSEYVETEAAAGSQSSHATQTTFPASTPTMRRKARLQFATLCWALFLAGWNDGTTGPLLPRIQAVYNIGFAVVSLNFVFNCIGFVTGAAANVWLTDRYGFGTVMVIGALAQVVGYTLEAPAPPFPVFVMGYAVNGFGLALQNAGANGYVASLKDNAATKMGILHAIYGAGALSSPLVATQFAQLSHWSFHYLVSLGIAISNVILLIAVFRFKNQETCLAEIGQTPSHESLTEGTDNNNSSKYTQMFKLRALHLMAFFILTYVGVEVTLGGWIVTYVIKLRGGGPSSGYISSGFFGGLTLGRVGLLWVNKKVGPRRAVFIYAILAIGLELVIWLVPSLIGGAVAVSFVGALLGPIYPIVMGHAGRVLPQWLLNACIGWIAGFGQAGSAFLPFLTGVLASRVGIKSLQPLLVSMMGLMIVLWALVPSASRRMD